jgi:NLI interacting factor-like phosphatase
MTMAYYPGNYYSSRLEHYYSQGLFDPYPTYSTDDRPRTPEYQYPPLPLPSLPRFPLAHSSTRSSPSPPPPPAAPSPPAARPSPSYRDFASEPSKALPEPTRKLLILDLNGTLLLRSPRAPKANRGQHTRSHPAPRRVIPRPYLAALRAYLFAPETRAWLDVMVWSSAQPHSVEDMVSHALGDDREWLVAIWARDTLGLAGDHYRASFLPLHFPTIAGLKAYHNPLSGIRDKNFSSSL